MASVVYVIAIKIVVGRIIAFKQTKNFVYVAEVRFMLLYTSTQQRGMAQPYPSPYEKDVVDALLWLLLMVEACMTKVECASMRE